MKIPSTPRLTTGNVGTLVRVENDIVTEQGIGELWIIG